MTDLPPAAQAVLQAFDDRYENCGPFDDWQELCLAAALRAVADQSENFYDPHEGKVSVVRTDRIIAIADELDR